MGVALVLLTVLAAVSFLLAAWFAKRGAQVFTHLIDQAALERNRWDRERERWARERSELNTRIQTPGAVIAPPAGVEVPVRHVDEERQAAYAKALSQVGQVVRGNGKPAEEPPR